MPVTDAPTDRSWTQELPELNPTPPPRRRRTIDGCPAEAGDRGRAPHRAGGNGVVVTRGPIGFRGAVTRGSAAEIVYATGAVEPETWSRSTPLVRGRIVERCRCEGKIVKAGDVLARLDDKEALATLNDLRALEEFQRREFDRQAQLLARGSRLLRPIRGPRAIWRIRAQIAAQTQRLDYYKLVAPMDGTVLKEDGEVGDMVDPGTILYRIGLEKPLWVIADVNEEDIPRVRIGQKALLRTDAFADQVLPGSVKEITPAGDPVSKTFRVRIGLPNDTPLRVGMSVEANIVSREKSDVLLVPANAVVDNSLLAVENDRSSACTRSRSAFAAPASLKLSAAPARASWSSRPRPPTSRTDHGSGRSWSSGPSMNLILTIAWTHVRHRARQTLVAIAGVMTGVGFSIMMAAMMEGSQDDFIKTLVDALPHISVTDELRQPTRQPADTVYAAAEFHGLTPEVRRPGIKNPMATIASLQSWVPGALTPSVQSKAVLRFAGRNLTTSVIGIDPRTEGDVSNLATHMRQGTLKSLYRASNAILLGDRLAKKIGARVNSNITLASAEGATMSATVVGTFHSGFRVTDETTGYVLLKTAQILERQTGIVNEIRVRTRDPMEARLISERISEQTGYKSISWQEAQEDLLSAITLRNVLMYTIVGAILLVASFGTYNIISTITHEKTRDIAILKSLGFQGLRPSGRSSSLRR